MTILESNNLSTHHPSSSAPDNSDFTNLSNHEIQQLPTTQPVPFKFLVTGKTIAALFYSSCDLVDFEDQYDHVGTYDIRMPAGTVFQASIYNPLFSLQCSDKDLEMDRKCHGDISVFDMAVTYNSGITGIGEWYGSNLL